MSLPFGMSLLQAIRVNITHPLKFLQTLSQRLLLSLFFSFLSSLLCLHRHLRPPDVYFSFSLFLAALCRSGFARLDFRVDVSPQHCTCTWENWFLDLAAEVLCLSCVINRNIKLFITFTKRNIKAIKRLLQHNIEIIAHFITQTP